MGNESGRQCFQVKVHHAIGADHHGGSLVFEGVYDGLQRGGRTVEIVGVELYGIESAAMVSNGQVPAAANAQVGLFGTYDYQFVVLQGKFVELF